MAMATNNNIERRAVIEQLSVNNRTVEGYAAVFGKQSEWLGYYEVIEPGALDGVIERSDVKALLNHDESRGLLARSRDGKGSLSLSIDDKGLKYRFDAPKTALGDELIEMLTRGDISGSSFAFVIDEDGDEWSNDYTLRKITKIKRLYDVSPVYDPAYADTEAAMATRSRRMELDGYYQQLKDRLK